MASHIEIIGVSRNSFFKKKELLSHAVQASKKCLRRYKAIYEIDLLICSSIYRDHHIVEPALSSLILDGLTKRTFFSYHSGISSSNKIFSFDLNNGPCGLLQSLALIDQQIQSGAIKSGLLVVGDSASKTGLKENYSFIPGAAAILLSRGKEGKGFLRFQDDSYMDYQQDYTATSLFRNEGRMLKIESNENYVENLAHCAAISYKKFLEKENLSENEIDLVICSQYPQGFISLIQDQLALGERIIQLDNKKGSFHSAAPLFALHSVYKSPVFQAAKKVLFLTAGSGINISIALYQQ